MAHPPGIEYRPPSASDSAALRAMARGCFSETFADRYEAAPFAVFLDHAYGDGGTMHRDLGDPDVRWQVAFAGDMPIGYAKVVPLRPPAPDPLPGALELQQIYVLAEWQGTGVARRLMGWALDVASSAPQLYLTVFDDNERAKGFYRRHGFAEVARCTFVLGDRVDDDRIWCRTMRSPAPFVFDVDGTICFDGTTISAEIVDALVECASTHRLVFASARPIRDLVPVIPRPLRGASLVGGNGAQISAEGETRTQGFSPEVRARLDELVDELGVTYFVDGPWDYSTNGDTTRPIFRQVDPARSAQAVPRDQLETYIKMVLFSIEHDHIEAVRRLPVTLHVHDSEGHLDLSPAGIDKGATLAAAGIGAGGFVAFGNDANDASMFELSATAICVGDHPVGRLADHVISRDQVASTIRWLARSH